MRRRCTSCARRGSSSRRSRSIGCCQQRGPFRRAGPGDSLERRCCARAALACRRGPVAARCGCGACCCSMQCAMAINLLRGRRELDCGCGLVAPHRSAAGWWCEMSSLAALLALPSLPDFGSRDGTALDYATVAGALAGLRAAVCIRRAAARRGQRCAVYCDGVSMTAFMISHLVLWALVIALSLVVFALARQIGVLHDRIAPTGALMLAKGPDRWARPRRSWRCAISTGSRVRSERRARTAAARWSCSSRRRARSARRCCPC